MITHTPLRDAHTPATFHTHIHIYTHSIRKYARINSANFKCNLYVVKVAYMIRDVAENAALLSCRYILLQILVFFT